MQGEAWKMEELTVGFSSRCSIHDIGMLETARGTVWGDDRDVRTYLPSGKIQPPDQFPSKGV